MTFQTFTGKEYLKIDIANSFGLDKEDWDTRLDWFDQVEGNLEQMVKDAEEPALFFAGSEAYQKACRGEPVNHPISLDATASGLQLLACLTGCRKSALLCNVLDAGKRMDAYVSLYLSLIERTGGKATIDRKDTKKAIMTAFYTSRAVPKRVFGEGELLQKFYQTLAEEAPGAWELNEAFLAMWQPDVLSNDWMLPDGFEVKIKVMGQQKEVIHFLNAPYEITQRVNMPQEEGRSLGANINHSIDGMVVREMNRRCNYNPVNILRLKEEIFSRKKSLNRPRDQQVIKLWKAYEKSGFLSYRLLTYLDHENAALVDTKTVVDMIARLPKKPFEVLSIHDCFRCLPNYGNDLRMMYNTILSEIARSNMLEYIVNQIIPKPIKVNKRDDIANEIMESNYALS